MQIEPHEIRIRRTPRADAVRRARALIGSAESRPAAATSVLDEAFADLPASTGEIAEQLSSQLRQLDAQRERLAALLSGLDEQGPGDAARG